MRFAAVVGSPVFGVPVGSIRRMCTSPSRATGLCSTPFGTTKTSPSFNVTSADDLDDAAQKIVKAIKEAA